MLLAQPVKERLEFKSNPHEDNEEPAAAEKSVAWQCHIGYVHIGKQSIGA